MTDRLTVQERIHARRPVPPTPPPRPPPPPVELRNGIAATSKTLVLIIAVIALADQGISYNMGADLDPVQIVGALLGLAFVAVLHITDAIKAGR